MPDTYEEDHSVGVGQVPGVSQPGGEVVVSGPEGRGLSGGLGLKRQQKRSLAVL